MQKLFIFLYIIVILSLSASAYGRLISTKGKMLTTSLAPTISTFTTLDKTTEASKSKERQRKSRLLELKIFISDNIEKLTVDIASGGGESLDSLAEIAQVPLAKKKCFFGILKKNFNEIFPDTNTSQKHIFLMIRGFIKGYVKKCISIERKKMKVN